MSLEWNFHKLEELINLRTGKLDSNAEEENGVYPFFTCAPDPLKINSFSFNQKAILLAGNNANGNFHINYYEGKFDAYQRTYVIDVLDNEKINLKYLYYALKICLNDFKRMSQGTSTRFLTKKILDNFEIQVPPIETQLKIVDVLDSITNKIIINQRINNNLEQLSQNLFRKWFIDFQLESDFNISEPLKESSLGKIPESWEIKTIGDLSIVKGRIGWRGYTTNDLVDDGPWVVGGKEITSGFIDFSTAKHLTREKYEESPEIMLKDKDLIIAKTGTIGPIAMFYENYGEATLNPNVGLIRANNIAPSLLLTFFKTPRAQYYLNEFTTSSVQPAINQTTIKQLEIALPSDKRLLDNLGERFEEINLLQYKLNEETKNLQKLRDTLLPKLMSGEIDVSKINYDLE